MAVQIFETSKDGKLFFSVGFGDAVFAIFPSCAVVLALLLLSSAKARRRADEHRSAAKAGFGNKIFLFLLLALHAVSLGLYYHLPKDSTIVSSSTAAAYSLRFLAVLLVSAATILLKTQFHLTRGIYLLATCLADGFRAHTLWVVVQQPGESGGVGLASSQTAIIAVTAAALILAEMRSIQHLKTSRNRVGAAHVEEEGSGILSMLFFGWLWPLLAFGNKNKITVADMESTIVRPEAVFRLSSDWRVGLDDKKFFSELAVQFLFGVVLQVMYAGAILAQPFIVQGIVAYLQNEKSNSSGAWLIVAMTFDQLAISVFEAHGSLVFGQLSVRMRSFLVHKVSLRSFDRSSPAGGWSAAEGKVLVHVTQDAAAVAGAVSMAGMIIPNIFVVSIGSYMLFRLINLAFLGPLLAAIACTLVPMLMGGPVSRSERKLLEATERRVTTVKQLIYEIRNLRFADMQRIFGRRAANERQQEIDAATIFRRIITVVIVAAVALSSLATLAAFGGFSLLSQHNLDYTVLFTSLSTMQIMLTPLLSIIQMLPSLIGARVSYKRLFKYFEVDDEGSLSGPSPLNFEKSVPARSPRTEDHVVRMTPLLPRRDNLALKIEDLTSGWTTDVPFVQHTNLQLATGRLAILAGAAGSGKSSLLKSVLGQTRLLSGAIEIGAKQISHCDQEVWFIPEASIHENILFGKAYNETLYTRVVACCCLDRDFLALDDGDQTKLSMIGSPLSGGQRRRVSLARTLYDCGDLFLLDDPFNGLDTKTRNEVAAKLFGPGGFLSDRRATSVLCCTEPPAIMSTFANTEFYVLESGSLKDIEKSVFVDGSAGGGVAEAASSTEAACASGSQPLQQDRSDSDNVADTNDFDALSDTDTQAIPAKKSLEAHRIYFKSLGSPFVVSAVVAFMLGGVAIERGSAFWLSHWTSQYGKLGVDVDNGYYVGIYAAISVASVLSTFICIWIFFMRAIPNSSISLHRDMLSVLKKTAAFTVEQHKSETVNRFTNDIEAVDLHLPQALMNLMTAAASAIGSIIVIGLGSPFTLISLPILVPLIFFLQKFYLATSFQLRSLQIAAQAPMLEMVSATVKGRTTIMTFRQEEYIARIISERIQRGLKMSYLFRAIQTWVTMMLSLLNGCVSIALASLLICLGGSKTVTWGGLALVNVIRLGQDSMLLLNWWTSFESYMASMDRIYDYIRGTPQESISSLGTEPISTWPENGGIQVNDLSLAYRSRHIVKTLNLSVPPGTKLAILGRTGSGKTSLLQSFLSLIRRAGGSVQVDGIDIASLDGDTVRSRFVGHPQSFMPDTSATVRQNLDSSSILPDSRIQEVLTALTAPHMAVDIMSRLDSQWSECNFSDGWQRIIGISRTLLRESSVYVMDEPTSGMDEESHNLALEAIFSALHGKTVISTTHMLSGIEKFDQVIVLEDGRLAEQGSPSELLAEEGSMLNQLIKAD